MLFKELLFKLALLSFSLIATTSVASDIFVAPGGASNGDGSQSAPFASLAAALSSGKLNGNDKVILRGGEYGDVAVSGARFDTMIQVLPADGEKVHFTTLVVDNSQNITFSGFQIWPNIPKPSQSSLVQTSGNSTSITFENLDIRSQKNAHRYRTWGLAKWREIQIRGILLRGERNSLKNSQVTGLYIAISSTGKHALISGNHVSGFSGDAFRALGDYSLVTGNYAEDCFQIDGNHADAFQSWSLGPNGQPGNGTVRGLTIERNIFIEWVGNERNGLRCTLQGIGLFDGMFENLTIQNNVISARAYHGISVAGAINSAIVNNTVVNADGSETDRPWIAVSSHKRGTLSRNVIVANNLAMGFRIPEELRMPRDGNQTTNSPRQLLIDPFGLDFRPRPNSNLINAANDRYAPLNDLMGTQRPKGGQSDVGAFEAN